MKIISLNIGQPQVSIYKNKEYVTGIGKSSKNEVMLFKDRFEGDGVANPTFHGGPDRAVCFYPFEHYEQWEKEFNTQLSIPAFGENLTIEGMLEKDVCIGDIIQIGDAVVQISQGRIPCSTISKFNGIDLFLKRTIDTCYSGYFARVLKEGIIRENSEIILIDRHPMAVSVFESMFTYFHQNSIESIQKVVQIPELAPAMKEKLEKKITKLKNNINSK
ncbi:MOSC domain-containing protein [Heyndrickxia sp. NPDC080065]|uniref:MOSC domain-containing protein n=1 Tax=Heyndrickxia sp. NPDC080065 TaxID=3390568 RepID=UPI003CFE2276